MRREYHRWYSPSLHRDMELLVFGHGGAKVVAYPTSRGRFHEWEDRGMIHGTLSEHLHRGWLQVCCVDGIDNESWYARWKHPHWRSVRQSEYDNYVRNEVLPLLDYVNPTPFVITTGASFGAYHAMNFALKNPDRVNRVLGMSGVYDIRTWTDGFYNEQVYFNNPVDYVGGEQDYYRIEKLRRMDIIMAVGSTDRLKAQNDHLSGQLWSKGVGNAVRVWDGFAHDWPAWDRMLRLYMGGHD